VWASIESAVAPDDRTWVGQHLLPLVGVEQDDVSESRDESFAAWRRYFEGLADQRSLVLVFEDLLGATTDCSTSSIISPTGRRASRSASSVRHGRSSWTGARGGAEAS
jgi:hypothetical protein